MIAVVPLSVSAVSYDPRGHQSKFGIKGGFLLGSRVRIDNGRSISTIDTEAGLTGGIFLDIPQSEKIIAGVALDLYDVQPARSPERRKFLDASISVKWRFPTERQRVEIRPGLAIGFGYLAAIGFIEEPTRYITTKAIFEVVFLRSRRFQYYLETAVVASPFGGNSDLDITFRPTLIFRGGAGF